jgi:hypothetical protein
LVEIASTKVEPAPPAAALLRRAHDLTDELVGQACELQPLSSIEETAAKQVARLASDVHVGGDWSEVAEMSAIVIALCFAEEHRLRAEEGGAWRAHLGFWSAGNRQRAGERFDTACGARYRAFNAR